LIKVEVLDPVSPIFGIGRFRDDLQIRNQLPEADVALMPEY
jgi:hypothetical protein